MSNVICWNRHIKRFFANSDLSFLYLSLPRITNFKLCWVICQIILITYNLDTVLVFLYDSMFRNSRPKVFCKKDILKNFGKFTRKHLCQSLFFNKVAGLRHRRFPVNSAKFLRTPFLIEHLCWLLMFFVRNVTCKVYEEHLPDFESSHLPLL